MTLPATPPVFPADDASASLPSRSGLRRRSMLAAAVMAPWVSLSRGAADGPVAGGEYLLTGARVIRLDGTATSLQADALDVHVVDGHIAAIGPSLQAPSAERIALQGRVLMPGLVDTHWHMWNSMARGWARSSAGGFAKTMAALAKVWTPEASALGVRLAMAEAVHAGITTVNNWAHHIQGPAFAEAELKAQQDSGVRGRFSYGYPQSLAPDRTMDLRDLASFKDRHFDATGRARLTSLGVCTRGPDRSDERVWRGEWEAVRGMGLPLSAHLASDRAAAAKGNIARLFKGGHLGPDVQLVHATHATPRDLQCMVDAGSPLSISPWTELEVGYGLPPLGAMAASGVQIGLSIDNLVLAGHADMFGVMRLAVDLAAGAAEDQFAVSDAKVLHWATLGGAQSLGLGERTGSLTVGKRADLIAVRADALLTAPVSSVAFMLTHAAQPQQVDLVMIDGVLHKRDGRLLRVDVPDLLSECQDAMQRLQQAAKLS